MCIFCWVWTNPLNISFHWENTTHHHLKQLLSPTDILYLMLSWKGKKNIFSFLDLPGSCPTSLFTFTPAAGMIFSLPPFIAHNFPSITPPSSSFSYFFKFLSSFLGKLTLYFSHCIVFLHDSSPQCRKWAGECSLCMYVHSPPWHVSLFYQDADMLNSKNKAQTLEPVHLYMQQRLHKSLKQKYKSEIWILTCS